MSEALRIFIKKWGWTLGFILIVLVPALMAIPISSTGQPGHISAGNAFLAPFLGPFSVVLPPNPFPMERWPASKLMIAYALALSILVCGGCLYAAKWRWLQFVAGGMTILLLIVWDGFELIKVLLELS